MASLIADDSRLQLLTTGYEWVEGPAWIAATGRLRFSSIPASEVLEYDAASGEVHMHDADAEYANGRTVDADGRVVQCSHGRRRVEREEADGRLVGLADRWAGGRFNSPNDVVVASDGAVWFTDPPYGIHESGREGHPGEQEYGACYVFRIDPATGEAEPVITDMVHPNGLAFSPDESVLYVADTGFLWADAPREIRAYDVDGWACTGGRRFAVVPVGASDGFRVDEEGRIWTSAGDGVYVYSPGGELLEHVPVPETVSNVAFGGEDGRDLYITATTSLYRVRTTTRQAPRPAFRG
ncbi:SMP-30/gluconolactonase/LRE family protein [Homoserinibacter sp. GY 40078]|uniref:SMP-30/gluconolactonase/LRE family protein n=1 Tax=Homoserinibacter sp. GY 40078 TaxID=2603275 RepID=UPI0011C760C9|nr:SMP-30/gluconolactonase/LRE family protein [Homoserinibacter sp. GY 40078]TXK19436.1 SMP-30/gluconolactonase/LRE family protein [Homoserinibacter sp. GY 40078]